MYVVQDKGRMIPERWAVQFEREGSRKDEHIGSFVREPMARAYAHHLNKILKEKL